MDRLYSCNPLRRNVPYRHLPALRLQAGELTRSNRAALLPVVEPAVRDVCKRLKSLAW